MLVINQTPIMDLKDHPATEEPEHPVMKCTNSDLKLLARCISALNRLAQIQFLTTEFTIVKQVIRSKLVVMFDKLFSGGEIDEKELYELEDIVALLTR